MARRRLPDVQRSAVVTIRLRPWELEAFRAAASSADATLAEYIRGAVSADASRRLTAKTGETNATK